MHNTTVAKLLAKENIEVQYGNYKTAWFDIQSRVLGLPMWKDMGKDVHDLFVGHEVGHALYTPFEGWHDTPEKLEGCPRSYINVVEDARIEKMIRREYPGLVAPFARGYRTLADQEFFGDISDIDWDQVKLIDKINLKAKLNNLIEVPFNTEEATLFNKTMNTETFAEVLDVVREILAYTKEHQDELMQKPEPQVSQGDDSISPDEGEEDMTPQGHDDMEMPGDQDQGNDNVEEDTSTEDETDNSAGQEEQEGDSSSDQTEETDQPEIGETSEASKTPEANEEDVSITDEIFRNSEARLLDADEDGNQVTVGRDRGKENVSSTVIPYSKLRELRAKVWAEQDDYIVDSHKDILDGYAEYMRSVKKSVNVAVKEFEMKKAAFQWQRASTAKTGVLDTNSLHQYKTHDDIFKRVTHLADAKNHGMIMLIDYSGSMASTLPQVLDQLIHLVTFCKAINIPFDVYAFTTEFDELSPSRKIKDGEICFDNMSLPQLISSSLSKAHYEEALQHLYMRKLTSKSRYVWEEERYYDRAICASVEDFGSTPLNAALIVSHTLVKNFRKKHNIDKMNLVVLSDGDSNNLQVCRDYNLEDKHADTISSWSGPMNILIDNKKIKIKGRRTIATKTLLENLKKRYDVTTLGFFIAQDRHDWSTKIAQIEGQQWIDRHSSMYQDFQKQYRKNKVAVANNALGYDKFFMLKPGKDLSTENGEFSEAVTEDMSTAQIRNSFKKFSKNKKNNKVLMKQLGGVVA